MLQPVNRLARLMRSPPALALIAALALAVSLWPAPASASQSQSSANWGSSTPANSIAATLTVPALSCTNTPTATGESLGVELLGSTGSPAVDFAGITAQCDSPRSVYQESQPAATYAAEFTVPSGPSGTPYTTTPSLTVSPGDLLRLSITSTATGTTLTITDLTTPGQPVVTTTGPALGTLAGWQIGAFAIPADSGAAPTAPTVFTDVEVGNVNLAELKGASSTEWVNGTQPLATVSSISSANNAFTVYFGDVKQPVIQRSVVAAPTSGTVLYELPGTDTWLPLTSIKNLPVGTIINVTNGEVQVSDSLGDHQTQSIVLWGGEFVVTQDHTGLTTFQVSGTTNTTSQSPNVESREAHAKKTTKKKLGSLWASGHGNFTTKGNYGAGSVRGTTWLTRNQTNGTYFYVTKNKRDTDDVVVVTVYFPTQHTVTLRQGHGVLAPAGTKISLSGAPFVDGKYDVSVGGTYTLTLASKSRPSYIDAAVDPLDPLGGMFGFSPDGMVNGIPRWTFSFYIAPQLGAFQTWNIGVQIAGKLYTVPLRIGR